jgi:hypothetical protein
MTSQQGVPRSLPFAIFQLYVTDSDSAETSVGISSQSRLLKRWNVDVKLSMSPSSVGTNPVILFDAREKAVFILLRAPNSLGTVPFSSFS